MSGFSGFDKDGSALYDTKEAALERARQLIAWGEDPNATFMVQRNVPLWFAHLVRGTWFEFLGYSETK